MSYSQTQQIPYTAQHSCRPPTRLPTSLAGWDPGGQPPVRRARQSHPGRPVGSCAAVATWRESSQCQHKHDGRCYSSIELGVWTRTFEFHITLTCHRILSSLKFSTIYKWLHRSWLEGHTKAGSRPGLPTGQLVPLCAGNLALQQGGCRGPALGPHQARGRSVKGSVPLRLSRADTPCSLPGI